MHYGTLSRPSIPDGGCDWFGLVKPRRAHSFIDRPTCQAAQLPSADIHR